jgi:2-polyprenyl-6-methoxyphenol hydroxylase-like FAD-dependent oxidoreductase
MHYWNRPLIVGAGPVGLAAAVFLASQGRIPRVIEMLDEPSKLSKALAVNPRTLEILEPTGITGRMLELGMPVHGARLYNGERLIGTLLFRGIHSKYPFMLALSQATTESLLADALESLGGQVERGVRMVDCRNFGEGIEVTIKSSANGDRQVVQCPWLFSADGAHSATREKLELDFEGSSPDRTWYLTDAPLETTLAHDHAHAIFLDSGSFLFLIRVVDFELGRQYGQTLWRVMSDMPDPLSHLVMAEPLGPSVWSSDFHVSHRIASTLSAGKIYLAGDAAHIHSPIGARGMNLGIEDAKVFAELARTDQLSDYDRLRRPVDRAVVRRVELLTKIVASRSPLFRTLRAPLLKTMINVPFLRFIMLGAMTVLDHPLPGIPVQTNERIHCIPGSVGCYDL